MLQCGRIYKDAEMTCWASKMSASYRRFNVAASIKMRKCHLRAKRPQNAIDSFNVAASIKMRKSYSRRRKPCGLSPLQCGRIYKDAEIPWRALARSARNGLQCGRIYKDAEIVWRNVFRTKLLACFNVAASIKMRKFRVCSRCRPHLRLRFNVAASIKMRKSKLRSSVFDFSDFSLQCGRIYKDAEIFSSCIGSIFPLKLQCGRIYKDAEI